MEPIDMPWVKFAAFDDPDDNTIAMTEQPISLETISNLTVP